MADTDKTQTSGLTERERWMDGCSQENGQRSRREKAT